MDVEEWASENYSAALDLVFANSCAEINSSQQLWTTCIRIVPSFFGEPEYGLYLEKHYDGRVYARIAKPRVKSLYGQLCDLKRQNPSATLPDLGRLLSLETREVTGAQLPDLRSLAVMFEKLRLSPASDDTLRLDPATYFFKSESRSGDEIRFVLHGPGPYAKRQPSALIQWIESFRSAMEAFGK